LVWKTINDVVNPRNHSEMLIFFCGTAWSCVAEDYAHNTADNSPTPTYSFAEQLSINSFEKH
jgi:hypothetical protein